MIIIHSSIALQNRILVKMDVQCDVRFKTSSKPSNLHRQKQTVHKNKQTVNPYFCSNCEFRHTSLVPMKEHFQQIHNLSVVNHCCFCNNLFGDTTEYTNHFETFHNLPVNFVQKNYKTLTKVLVIN